MRPSRALFPCLFKNLSSLFVVFVVVAASVPGFAGGPQAVPTQDSAAAGGRAAAPASASGAITGFRDAAEQHALDQRFIAVPDAKLAEEHLRTLTAKPHLAGTPEDKETAEYVARKFREAGLETSIVEYKAWLNYPREISVDITAPKGVRMHGPTRERVEGDPFQDDPRVIPPINGSAHSGDVEAEVVYANYGRPEDFAKLKELGVDVRGKIAIVRYGANYRGVK